MRKDQNEWKIDYEDFECDDLSEREVDINDNRYIVGAECAALCHAILLLVDAINDKDFK